MTFIAQSYFDTLLRYVLSVTFCGAVVLKVMDSCKLITSRTMDDYRIRRQSNSVLTYSLLTDVLPL